MVIGFRRASRIGIDVTATLHYGKNTVVIIDTVTMIQKSSFVPPVLSGLNNIAMFLATLLRSSAT